MVALVPIRPMRPLLEHSAAARTAGSTTPNTGTAHSSRSTGSAVVDTVPQATTMALGPKPSKKAASCRAYLMSVSRERPP